MSRILGTYALVDLTESTILGIFDSTDINCAEFYICSSNPKNCLKARKDILDNMPLAKNFKIRNVESDFLLIEGGAEIARESRFSKYARGSFNIGFLGSAVLATAS